MMPELIYKVFISRVALIICRFFVVFPYLFFTFATTNINISLVCRQ